MKPKLVQKNVEINVKSKKSSHELYFKSSDQFKQECISVSNSFSSEKNYGNLATVAPDDDTPKERKPRISSTSVEKTD